MKKFIIVLLLAFMTLGALSAADLYYEKGDSAFSFNLGVDFPVFIGFTNNDKGIVTGSDGTHLKLGGYGSLSYQGFLTRKIALGAELGYAFNYSRAEKLFNTIPITAKLSWYAFQNGKWDFIVHTNLGIAVLRYDDQRYLSPHAEITISPVFYFTNSWGAGIKSGMWVNGEFYGSSSNKNGDSAIAGFVPLTLLLIYRH